MGVKKVKEKVRERGCLPGIQTEGKRKGLAEGAMLPRTGSGDHDISLRHYQLTCVGGLTAVR